MPLRSRAKSGPRAKSAGKSRYLTLDPRHHKTKWASVAFLRLFLVGSWTTAIAFGAKNFFVVIHDKQLFGYNLSVDSQLALLGVINKLLDVLVLTSLQDVSHVLVLVWMMAGTDSKKCRLVGRGTGARVGDLEMFEELSKPWRACSAFWTRWRSRGWKKSGFSRFLITLTISVCVMWQGLAINLLGMPKDRWYPDERYDSKLTLRHPSAHIQSIDNTLWSQGFDIVGGGRYSWDAAGAYSTASAYVNLQDLVPKFSEQPGQWTLVGAVGQDTVTLDTRYDGTSAMRGFAVKSSIAQDIFHWAQSHGTSEARAAMGWIITLRMIVPMVAVSCVDAETQMLDTESVVVDKANTNTSSFVLSTRSVSFDDQPNTTFTSIQCSVSLSRAIVPIWSYVRDNGTADVDPDAFVRRDVYSQTIANLGSAPVDIYLAQQVRSQLLFITSRFENLVSNTNAAQLLGRNALHLRSVRPDINTDASALAPAIALIATHVLAHSFWNYTLDTDDMLVSTSVRWQLLAAGPYLQWEWIAAIVLIILALVTLAAFGLSLVSRLAAPDFLNPSGLLVAANLSDRLPVLKVLDADDKHIEEQTLFLRQIGRGQTARVSIVQESYHGSKVDVTQAIKWS